MCLIRESTNQRKRHARVQSSRRLRPYFARRITPIRASCSRRSYGQHAAVHHFTLPAFAADKPAIGTWPDGSKGDTVNIGAAVPRTGTYAVQGEDELKGWQLAVEHINTDHELIKKIAPKINKGVLGKKVKLVAADSAAKPNQAVQDSRPSSTRTRSC